MIADVTFRATFPILSDQLTLRELIAEAIPEIGPMTVAERIKLTGPVTFTITIATDAAPTLVAEAPAIARMGRQQKAAHGTDGAYHGHRSRQEPACAACCSAHAYEEAKRAARRKSEAVAA